MTGAAQYLQYVWECRTGLRLTGTGQRFDDRNAARRNAHVPRDLVGRGELLNGQSRHLAMHYRGHQLGCIARRNRGCKANPSPYRPFAFRNLARWSGMTSCLRLNRGAGPNLCREDALNWRMEPESAGYCERERGLRSVGIL
jgi:hypothetical protein